MRDLRDLGHQRHDRAGGGADHECERDQIELVAAQKRAEADQEPVRLAIDDMSDPREHWAGHFLIQSAADLARVYGLMGLGRLCGYCPAHSAPFPPVGTRRTTPQESSHP